MDVADLVGAPLKSAAPAAGQGRAVSSGVGGGLVRTASTLVAFFVGGALWLWVEGALATPERPSVVITVAADATEAEVARATDEEVLVQVGLQLGWREDSLIVDRLTRALGEATPDGTTALDHAEALGLHTRDPLVRARLMENARRSLPEPGAPPEAELEAWFKTHAERFKRPPRLSLDHRFTKDPERAQRMLAAAKGAGEGTADRGEPELTLGPQPVRTTSALVAAVGGAAAAEIARAPLDTWVLVQSRLGYHVVRVVARDAAGVPALEVIRPEVIAAWREDQRPAFFAKVMARLRSAYDVSLVRVPVPAPEAK